MPQLDGGQLVMRTLAQAGVTHLFTIPGGHNFELLNACLDVGIRVIDVRHEQQAAHMADALTRVTGGVAAIAVDGAPGLVNAFPGIQIAFESQVPLVVLTGQGSLAGRDIGVMQAIDQLTLLRPITKWQRTCFEIKRLPEYAAAAVRHARSGRPGPVLLDFPLEVLRGTLDTADVTFPALSRPSAPQADPAQLQAALALLRRAERPLIVAGSGVHWAAGGAALLAFAEASGIPVLTRNLARGLVPDNHPLGLGFMPSGAFGADCYLVLGTRLDWTVGYGRPPLFASDAALIQVDIHAEAIGKTRVPDVGIVADAAAALRQLLALHDGQQFSSDAWRARAKGTVSHLLQQTIGGIRESRPDAAERPMHSIDLCLALRAALPADATVVIDGGFIAAYGLQTLEANRPGGVIWVGSTGHLGVGVAFANAAQLARPGQPVVALMGDGSFGLCAMEFDTAVRHNLPIVVVIANDQGWGEIRAGQQRRYGAERVVGAELGLTRYDELAVALGGRGELITRPEEIGPALERALASGRPTVLNVHTDPAQRSTAVSGLPWIIE